MNSPTDLTAALLSRGWRYDPHVGHFYAQDRLLELPEVLTLVPGFTKDELASWVAMMRDELQKRRQA